MYVHFDRFLLVRLAYTRMVGGSQSVVFEEFSKLTWVDILPASGPLQLVVGQSAVETGFGAY